MNVEKNRDYWTIVVDLGPYKTCPPRRVRLSREYGDSLMFSSEIDSFQSDSLSVLRRKLDRYIYETEEVAWRAFAKSDASPLGCLRSMRISIEQRVDDFRRLVADGVPEYVREILLDEVEAGERLLAQIRYPEENR